MSKQFFAGVLITSALYCSGLVDKLRESYVPQHSSALTKQAQTAATDTVVPNSIVKDNTNAMSTYSNSSQQKTGLIQIKNDILYVNTTRGQKEFTFDDQETQRLLIYNLNNLALNYKSQGRSLDANVIYQFLETIDHEPIRQISRQELQSIDHWQLQGDLGEMMGLVDDGRQQYWQNRPPQRLP